MQRQGGPAVLQPGKGAGVELDEGAHLRLRDAPHAGAPGAALSLGGLAEDPAESAHRAAAEVSPMSSWGDILMDQQHTPVARLSLSSRNVTLTVP